MGRKRDRLDAVDWPARLPVPAFHLDRLAARGAAGSGRYGDAVVPPDARVRKGPRCGHLVHAVRNAAARAALTPLTTIPPADFVVRRGGGAVAAQAAPATISTVTDADKAAAAAASAAAAPPPSAPLPASAAFHPPPPPPNGGLTPSELAVVREARAARRSWADVAALLPWRSAAGIKKMWLVATGRAPPPPPRGRPMSAGGGNDDGRPAAATAARVVVDDAASGGVDDEGEARVALKRRLGAPPPGTTVAQAHGVEAADGAVFYAAAAVVDGDDDGVVYEFEVGAGGGGGGGAPSSPEPKRKKVPRRGADTAAPSTTTTTTTTTTSLAHGACFNVGVAADGSTLLSWAHIVALYRLPDGTAWAETRVFVDGADFRAARAAAMTAAAEEAAAQGAPPPAPPPDLAAGLAPRELLARGGRVHSRLRAVEAECWLYEGGLPPDGGGPPGRADDAWFWRTEYDPATLQAVASV